MIALATFETYAVGGTHAGADLAIPKDTNGHSTTVAIDDHVNHVDDKNLIVLNDAGGPDLEGQIMYEVWMVAGRPVGEGEIKMTQAMLDDSSPRVVVAMARHTLLAAYGHALIARGGAALKTLKARESDVLRTPALDALMDKAKPNVLAVANQLYKVIERDTASRRAVLNTDTTTAKFAVISVCANAQHRHYDARHNWRGNTVAVKNSAAFKAVRLAAADQSAFVKFMAVWGHDLWHWLDDESLLQLGNVIAGAEPSYMTTWDYLGENVEGKSLPDVLKVTQAVRERMPPGVLGIAAIMTGTKALKAMLTDWSSKVSFSGQAEIFKSLTSITDWVSAPERTVAETRAVRAALADVLVVAYGYCLAIPALRDVFEDYKALEALGAYSAEMLADGKSLAGLISIIEPDESVIHARLTAVLGRVTDSVAAAVKEFGGPQPVALDELIVPKTAAARRAEAAEKEAKVQAISKLGAEAAMAAGLL